MQLSTFVWFSTLSVAIVILLKMYYIVLCYILTLQNIKSLVHFISH